MDDTQARLESHDNTLSPDVPDREPVKRKASASEDRLSPKRIKHDDHFREATNEPPRRDSLQSRRDSHGDSAGVDVDRRKLATQEEKKRGKRLFGGLLNTLSQTAGNTQHKRRLEIERRQQERIHKQSIEDGKVREEKRARITEIRKGEQIVFDEEVVSRPKLSHNAPRCTWLTVLCRCGISIPKCLRWLNTCGQSHDRRS